MIATPAQIITATATISTAAIAKSGSRSTALPLPGTNLDQIWHHNTGLDGARPLDQGAGRIVAIRTRPPPDLNHVTRVRQASTQNPGAGPLLLRFPAAGW